MKKKGTAGMAASLVGLLALLMLMYLFVIPPEFRQALLENNQYGIMFVNIIANVGLAIAALFAGKTLMNAILN